MMLDGLTAVVTGAGAGLGRAEALALAAAGAFVVLNDAADTVHDVAAAIVADGGQAVAVTGDIGAWETGSELVAACLRETGRLDIVVNNAGVLRDKMIFSMSAEEWDLVLRVHLRGHFIMTRLATAHWRALSKEALSKDAGGPVYGRIVNTSSEAFLLGSPGQPNYASAKAGIAALTVSTARGCARYGVRANAICPRARTAMTASLMGSGPAEGPDPLDPAYVAPLVVWLSSPAAAGVNGEVFVVHGGVCAVMNPPSVRTVFRSGAADGMWSLDAVSSALGPAYASSDGMSPGFACEDTLPLAESTIGFG
jgi:NAD(P)-dependent dehydrogenase (short-subunit alcohol dehydrogenase family)